MPDRGGWIDDLRARLASLRLSPAREAEIVEELSQHLDQRYDELRREGSSDNDARRLALAELREPDALARWMRPLRQANVPPPIAPGAPRGSFAGDLRQDLRYAARMLRRQPAFTIAAVVTLALGIGANSAMFALVDATLLRPLPLPDPDRLVVLWERTDTSRREFVSAPNMRDWRDRSRSLEAVGAFRPNVASMVLSGGALAEDIPRHWVTAGFFDALGVKPVEGRFFRLSDDLDRARAVVLTESFWRSRFNADRSLIGRDLRLDGAAYTVVGVAPDEAQIFGRTSMWGLSTIERATNRTGYGLRVIGRLKPGVTPAAAAADLDTVSAALAQEFPKTNARRGVTLEPGHDSVVGSDLRRTAVLFLGVVGFVLLICCANVANLLLARASARTRELAMRSALGADRRRLVRQLLTESLLLAVAGGVLGLALGAAILRAAPPLIPSGLMPPSMTLSFDLRVVLFCAGAAILVGLLFGLAPAWQGTAFSPANALASDGRTMTGRSGRLRGALVVAEVATAVLLLVGAGLLLRTLLVVSGVDRGYRAGSVLTMLVDPLGSQYPTPEANLQFYEAVAREVTSAPGVASVAWASTLPLGESYVGSVFFSIEGDRDPPPPESRMPSADYQIVSPDYFDAIDLALMDGRRFDARDTRKGLPVCIVNEAFVRTYLKGRSPIGHRVALRESPSDPAPLQVREIVGVARQVKGRPDETADLVQIYVPLAQQPVGDMFLLVRAASGPAEALTPGVRAAIGRIDKDQLVSIRSVQTLDDVMSDGTARYRFRAQLVLAFAVLALLLAMVGLFGVVSYSVQLRTRDFGVRRALGASTADVMRLVLRSAAGVIATGAVIGLGLAVALSRLLATMLFGVRPLDPSTFAAVAGVLALTAALSMAGPAWRATRVDPIRALRHD
jgi:putative ABC transport system permease protein